MSARVSPVDPEAVRLAEDMVEHLQQATREGEIESLRLDYVRPECRQGPMNIMAPYGPPAIFVESGARICLNTLAAFLLNNGWGRK